MIFTLNRSLHGNIHAWNGESPLPDKITVNLNDPNEARWGLLIRVVSLHGRIPPVALLNAASGIELPSTARADVDAIIHAFYAYLSMYTSGYVSS